MFNQDSVYIYISKAVSRKSTNATVSVDLENLVYVSMIFIYYLL